MKNKFSRKWAAWLVLVTLCLNILAPMPLWAAEQTEGAALETVLTASQEDLAADADQMGERLEEVPGQPEAEDADSPGQSQEPQQPEAQKAENGQANPPEDTVQLDRTEQPAEEDALAAETPGQERIEAAAKTAVQEKEIEQTIVVTFSIETRTINGQDIVAAQQVTLAKGASVYDALLKVAEENQVTVTGSAEWITAVNGITTDAEQYHAWSGWMFSQNGSFAIDTLIGATELHDQDVIRFVYCISDDYSNRSDVAFADLYVALKKLIKEAEALDASSYTVEQWQLLTGILTQAQQQIEMIDAYDSLQKADGLPGFILARDTALDADSETFTKLIRCLTSAIAKESVYIPVESITLEPRKLTMYVGESYQLQATVLPSYATDQQLKWEIVYNFNDALNPDVENGLIKAEKPTTTPVSVKVTCKDMVENNITPPTVVVTVKEAEPPSMPVAVAEAVGQTAGYLQGKNALNDWEAFALARAGFDCDKYIEDLQARLAAGEFKYIGDYAKAIIAVEALGYDATKIGGNLAAKMYSFPWSDMYGVYGYSYVLIAANLVQDRWNEASSTWGKEELLRAILAEQDQATGAFSQDWLSVDGSGMALQALSLYQGQPDVQKAIESCLAWLKTIQKPTGGFAADDGSGVENVNSTAEVLWALSALGIDSTQGEWVKGNGSNPYSALMSYANEDGSFNFSGDTNVMATYQAMIAMVALERTANGQPGIFDYSDAGHLQLEKAIRAGEAYHSQADTYTEASLAHLTKALEHGREVGETSSLQEVRDAAQAIWAAINALHKKVPAQQEQLTNGVYDLEGHDSHFTLTSQSTDVAVAVPENKILPGITASRENVVLEIPQNIVVSGAETIQLPSILDKADGDTEAALAALHNTVEQISISQRIWVGAQKSSTSFSDYVRLTFQGAAGQNAAYVDHEQKVHVILSVESEAAGQIGQLEEFAFVQGSDLVIMTKHFTEFMTYTVHSSGSGGGSAPAVTLSVDTKTLNGEYILAPTSVAFYSNDTPLSVLVRQLGADRVSVQNGSYVQSIDGYDDASAECGWMYLINGEILASIPANKYILQNGDRVEWRYTKKSGADLGTGDSPIGPGAAVVPITDKERAAVSVSVQKALAAAQRALLAKERVSVWEAFALAAGGRAVPSGTYEALLEEVQKAQGNFRKVTDTERMILAVTALGYDATQIGGYDLLAAVYQHEHLTKQGNNGIIYALLALDCGDYQTPQDALWTREKLVAYLLAQQNSDGGFALTKGSASDVDLTAMAVQSLAPYQAQAPVREATKRALGYLSQVQQADAGFASGGLTNGESAMQVLLALTALGIDPLTDGRFIKEKVTVWDQVLAYQLSDGTFCHTRGGESDELATEQGLLALMAMERFVQDGTGIFTGFAIQRPSAGFKDSTLISPWAAEMVQAAVEKGWLAGYTDGTFRPKEPITRAEGTALLLRAMQWPEDSKGQAPFTDTKDTWYQNAAAAAYEHGLVKGKGTAFAGEAQLTREELAAMLCRVKNLAESETPAAFADQAAISPWAIGAVQAACEQGLLVGDGEYFDPQGAVTREMAACAIYRAAQ